MAPLQRPVLPSHLLRAFRTPPLGLIGTRPSPSGKRLVLCFLPSCLNFPSSPSVPPSLPSGIPGVFHLSGPPPSAFVEIGPPDLQRSPQPRPLLLPAGASLSARQTGLSPQARLAAHSPQPSIPISSGRAAKKAAARQFQVLAVPADAQDRRACNSRSPTNKRAVCVLAVRGLPTPPAKG